MLFFLTQTLILCPILQMCYILLNEPLTVPIPSVIFAQRHSMNEISSMAMPENITW